jgi:glycosyltransferase involved in cell wall biosynthesis
MTRELSEMPLVSIIITSYNYERFLRAAINSALDQTYPNTEVIVVDDGSTDKSRQIIASYGDRIIPIFQQNGGQGSACNSGFKISRGEVTIFLDSDDALLPDTVRRVVAAFRSGTNVAIVQFRLQGIDECGNPTGQLYPPDYMPSGDLRQHILKFRSYVRPATSGNAFASAVLRQILPMPETLYRTCVDHYLCDLSVVFGTVVSLGEVGGCYRVHGKNHWASASITDMTLLREVLLAMAGSYAEQKRLLRELYSAEAGEARLSDLYFLSTRVISLKLDPINHPLEDRLLPLCVRGCLASITHPSPSMYLHHKLLYTLWFVAMFFAPRPLAKTLAENLYNADSRGRVAQRSLNLLRRIHKMINNRQKSRTSHDAG